MAWRSVVFKGGPRQPFSGERPEPIALVEPTARLVPTLALLIARSRRGVGDAVVAGDELATALAPDRRAAVLHIRILERLRKRDFDLVPTGVGTDRKQREAAGSNGSTKAPKTLTNCLQPVITGVPEGDS
jgi:hypothetical protein